MSKVWIFAVVVLVLVAAVPARVDAQLFNERFDTYVTGSMIAGQGGWETWDNNAGANTPVVSTQAYSLPNSLQIGGAADVVHRFTTPVAGTGVWFARTWVFVPSTSVGVSYFIMLNTYAPLSPPYNWSAQVAFCRTGCSGGAVAGMVTSLGGSEVTATATIPLILDAFIEIRAVINLTTNRYQLLYNGVQFYDQPWTILAPVRIQCIDLYSNNSTNMFMDNVWLDQTLPVEGMSFTVE
jgi:hypothetical protein